MTDWTDWTPGPWRATRGRLDGHEWFIESECRNLPPFNWNSRLRVKLGPLMPLDGKKHVDARSGCVPDDNNCCATAIRENRANARLIASAPDLYAALAALQEAAITMVGGGAPIPDSIWVKVADGLAKARGETE